MDGMGSPLMDISVRQADEGGSTGFWVESTIAAISGTKLERLGAGGRGRGKENLDIQDGGSEMLGKWNFQKSDSGLSNHGGVKPFNHIKGGTDGDPKTYGAHCKRRWILQEVFKGVGMEITKKMEAQNPHK